MFKNIIAPAQAWLLSQGRCVGCGKSLKRAKKEESRQKNEIKLTCQCGRVYIYNDKTRKYRRALFNEV